MINLAESIVFNLYANWRGGLPAVYVPWPGWRMMALAVVLFVSQEDNGPLERSWLSEAVRVSALCWHICGGASAGSIHGHVQMSSWK